MDGRNFKRSIDDLNKRLPGRRSEEGKKSRAKSPPNPFMSRLNISSFLDFMMADKNDQNYNKSRKNVTGNTVPIFANTVKLPKDNSQSSNNFTTNLSAGNSTTPNATNFIDLYNCSLTSCPVCTNEISDLLMSSYTSCSHVACISCWQCYVMNRIENYEFGYGFTCLTCSVELKYNNVVDIIKLTSDEEYSKKLLLRLENFYLERALMQDNTLRRCPHPGCGFCFFLIPDFSNCTKLSKCQLRPICHGQLCNNECVDFWKNVANHECISQTNIPSSNCQTDIDNLSIHNTAPNIHEDSNKSEHSRNLWLRCFPWRRNRNRKGSRDFKIKRKHGRGDDTSLSKSHINQTENEEIASLASIITDSEIQQSSASSETSSSRTKFRHSNDQIQSEGEVKTCPKCHTYVLKMNDGSCNHMVCLVCGCEFCWLCMRQITDMHYLSPSGCTFWGRRQWNVEKRALWQLGTLIGAPVAIGFLAALAIPAMVIGIPLYVGRKIHGALKTKNKDRKRTIAVAGGIGAFIVSPVIAAVAVGLGVPLILAYVYVVMPIALCRASACSCDDNIPPQDEVDFSEITSSQHHEFRPVSDQIPRIIMNESVERAVITRLPLDSDHMIITQSNSTQDIIQTPILSDNDNSNFSCQIKKHKSSKSEICESLSTSHLPDIRDKPTILKLGYSDPISICTAGDDRL